MIPCPGLRLARRTMIGSDPVSESSQQGSTPKSRRTRIGCPCRQPCHTKVRGRGIIFRPDRRRPGAGHSRGNLEHIRVTPLDSRHWETWEKTVQHHYCILLFQKFNDKENFDTLGESRPPASHAQSLPHRGSCCRPLFLSGARSCLPPPTQPPGHAIALT